MDERVQKLQFTSDYMEGAHPDILEKLTETNFIKTEGYGTDDFSKSAREKIRKACECPEAEVYFLVGGTQTNATVIDAVLKSYQGVVCAETGHISTHEAGAIEMSGHKVLPLAQKCGKITADSLESFVKDFYADENHEHMVMPGMVYLSQPTEYGTLYSLEELTEIRNICHKYEMALYVDGARLAYALACPQNNVTLSDLARLCDVFYIGGTKCGALFGEAVVIPRENFIPHFFTIMKQHGALLAKGWLLGIQFDVLFSDAKYLHIGEPAICCAQRIRQWCTENGIELCFGSPTNQVFALLENSVKEKLEQNVEFSFWEKFDENHTIVRFATSWATKEEDVEKLFDIEIRQ